MEVFKPLTQEPIFKKMLKIILLSIFFMSLILILLHAVFLNQYYSERLASEKALIGTLVKAHPEDEIKIVNAVKGISNKNIALGSKISSKYGYDNSFLLDNSFKKDVHIIILCDSIIISILLIMSLSIFIYCSVKFIKKIQFISSAIENIYNNNFTFNFESNSEGILSRLHTQFYQMARRVKMSMDSMHKEKENIKSLITDISHQLKTPLASIKLYNSLISEDNEISPAEEKEFTDTINKEVLKLEWLVGSLVKLSRLEAGMIEIKALNCSLKETILKAVEEVYPKALYKNTDIIIEDFENISIPHDAKWTKEAILNILENAIKYTDEDGRIKISVSNSNFIVRIDISDNGIGIPKEDYTKVFKRFFRGASSRVQNTEGSGVGLYLTRKILEEQGGSIIVDSAPNSGTTFSIFLQKCK